MMNLKIEVTDGDLQGASVKVQKIKSQNSKIRI